jgi:hypothetical protein
VTDFEFGDAGSDVTLETSVSVSTMLALSIKLVMFLPANFDYINDWALRESHQPL